MIIVKSKTTGKFLKHRSGSTRKLKHDTYHDIINDETLSLPEDDGIYYVDVDGTTSPRLKISEIIIDIKTGQTTKAINSSPKPM